MHAASIAEAALPRRLAVHAGSQFSLDDAVRLRALIAELPAGSEVELDLRDVREWHATALLRLARELVDGRVRIRILGLTHRHARLLGYLGVGPEALGLAGPGDAAGESR